MPSLAQLAALLLPAAAALAAAFAALAPEPYMDEPFHVPQTRRYCEGRWREWDHKITTFPGLYVFGALVGRLEYAAQRLLGAASSQLCSTTALRSVNLLFGAACLPLFHAAAASLDGDRSPTQLLLMTAACFLFPLHFFYQFLYYTDVPSLFFTLATILAAARRRYRLAGALGAAAVLMRQTNAVWVAYALAGSVLDACLPEDGRTQRKQQAATQDQRRGGTSSSGSSSGAAAVAALQTAAADLTLLLKRAWVLKRWLAAQLWPLGAVVASFAAFVVLNGGIVLGDKVHHTPVHHWAQPLYCLLYITAWLAPAFWAPPALAAAARSLGRALRSRPASTAVCLVAGAAAAAAAVHLGTLVHPFLLADNRHYVFYIWRRLVNRTLWSRYALVPAYLYSAWSLAACLAHHGWLRLLLLAGASCVVLIPAHLIEFRYFTVPFYLTFLHMRTPSTASLAAIVALFAAANAATIYLFLARPFAWADGSVARFIW
ncbi:Dol-P-Glc:Glc(2)Man(9) c(2)-PP-Dol alpha-1,2-glucosyltransferase [Chlorella sorokiniana]|uniref:Dol-P-Glc:Glc(2)Man(9)GlcNAc(2)-PP-Dol alpha-1,2-glucosyltransferase n=1 Tax=Chlorella sorokiniana TaxID=3076 RepID=A0A2P6TJ10_CHLSO|nr:Dol-P-Glc:Glc(2)Man(9) c(2)-PP-Dol alpha-1,2-glucosyltransferase [Chlorella sorokiniana]|eukprot:PRW39235.1 Dol-P-Glc:Glc(2)Man(9) c(2)-PP-Dol alpha-1,2-glucosyltransferase [Chlorella sorokiniana]